MRIKKNGFTLVELMVTISIMAIIAVLAAPSFKNQIHKSELQKDVMDFKSLLNEVRSDARLNNRTAILYLRDPLNTDIDNSYYWHAQTSELSNLSLEELTFRANGIVESNLQVFPICMEIRHKNSAKSTFIRLTKLGSVNEQNQGC